MRAAQFAFPCQYAPRRAPRRAPHARDTAFFLSTPSTLELGIHYRLAAQQPREGARHIARHPRIAAAAAAAVLATMAVTVAVVATAAATTEPASLGRQLDVRVQ